MTYRLVRLLQRRTAVDLSYRRRLARITGRAAQVRGTAGLVRAGGNLGPQTVGVEGLYHPHDGDGHGRTSHVDLLL